MAHEALQINQLMSTLCQLIPHGKLFLGKLHLRDVGIRMLTGIIKPDEGTAVIMGHDIKNDAIRAKQAMDIVPEMSNAYVELSAWSRSNLKK